MGAAAGTTAKSEIYENYSVVVGDATGNMFTYNSGDFTMHTEIPTGSTSKWPSAMMFAGMVAQGHVNSLDDPVNKYLPWWTKDPKDLRSTVTFRMLLTFTSGLEAVIRESILTPNLQEDGGETEHIEARNYDANGLRALGDPCDAKAGNITLCAQSIYNTVKLNGVPGKTYAYNSYHLQLAAAVAVAASGKPIQHIVKDFFAAYGMSESSYPGRCPEFAGGLITTGSDYEKFLRGVLAYDPLPKSLVDESEQDATPFLDGYTLYGHYAFGHFIECFDEIEFTKECAAANVHMDPGAFGFIPIIDRAKKYYVALVEAEIAPFGQYPLSGIPEYLAVAMKKHVDAILSPNPPPASAHLHHTPTLLSLSIADVNYITDCKLHPKNCD